MGKLFKLFRDEPRMKKKCGGFVHGYVTKGNVDEQFCVQITMDWTGAPTEGSAIGYVLRLSDREARKLHTALDKYLFVDDTEIDTTPMQAKS